MKKRFLIAILILIISLTTAVASVSADLVSTPFYISDYIAVIVDGSEISFDVPPVIVEGRLLVPIRSIFEALGAYVEWDQSTSTATSIKNDRIVKLSLENPFLYINDEIVVLNSMPCIIDGRILVPVRAISEAYGADVDWNENNKTVTVTSPTISEQQRIYQSERSFDVLSSIIEKNGSQTKYDDFWGAYSVTEDYGDSNFSMMYVKGLHNIFFTYATYSDNERTMVNLSLDKYAYKSTATFMSQYCNEERKTLMGYFSVKNNSFVLDEQNTNIYNQEAEKAMESINTALPLFQDKINEYGGNYIDLSSFGISYQKDK